MEQLGGGGVSGDNLLLLGEVKAHYVYGLGFV